MVEGDLVSPGQQLGALSVEGEAQHCVVQWQCQSGTPSARELGGGGGGNYIHVPSRM